MQPQFKNSIQKTLSNFIEEATRQISSAILKLQSDDVISQMRNDPTLYEYKMAHIQQLIKEHITFDKNLVDSFTQEMKELRVKNANYVQLQRRKDQEYLEQISNIQDKCSLYMREKEHQICELRNSQQQTVARMESQTRRLYQQLQQFKSNKRELEQTAQMNTLSLTKKDRLTEERIKQIQTNFQNEQKNYQELIVKMKTDMHLIKNQWQKKCQDITTQEKAKYKQQLILYQHKMQKQLQEYVQNLKLGRNVIIREDDQLVRSKVEVFQAQYENEIQKLHKKSEDAQNQIKELSSKLKEQQEQVYSLREENFKTRSQYEAYQCTYELQTQKLNAQNEKLNNRLNQKEVVLRNTQLEFDAVQNQLIKTNDELKLWKRKHQQIKIELQETNMTHQRLRADRNQTMERGNDLQVKLEQLSNTLKKREKQLQQLTNSLQKAFQSNQKRQRESQQNLSALQQRLSQQVKRNKDQRQKLRKAGEKIDKVYMVVKKFQKELILTKEQMRYQFQISKTKLSTDIHHQVQTIIQETQQQLQKKSKEKMMLLLDQVEQNQNKSKDAIDSIRSDNQNLRRELKKYDRILEEKDQQFQLIKHHQISLKLSQVQKAMAEDLKQERRLSENLRYQLQLQNDKHQRKIDELQNSVQLSVKRFIEKWSTQITKLQQQVKTKQQQISLFSEKTEKALRENQRLLKRQQIQEEDRLKARQRYEKLKMKSQQNTKDLLKRLDDESKHKRTLEQDLRQIRIKMNKYENPERTYQNKDSMKRDRSHNNAVYQTTRENHHKANLEQYHSPTNFKEKDLSQLRQMIAKTYKAFGDNNHTQNKQPERDHKVMKKF